MPEPKKKPTKSTDLFEQKRIFYLANLQKLAAISKCSFVSKISRAFVRLFLGSGIILLFIFSSCARRTEDPIVSQMRMRGMQTRSFVGHDAKTVTNEIIAVLQDQGYMVKNMSGDMGLLTAEKDTNVEKFSSKVWAYVFSGKRARWKKHSVIELTTNITEETGKTKVRVNYLIRIFDNLGRVVDVHQVLEEEVYTDFFNKVHKGLLAKQT